MWFWMWRWLLGAPFLNVAKISLRHRNQHEKLYMYPSFYENLRDPPTPKKIFGNFWMPKFWMWRNKDCTVVISVKNCIYGEIFIKNLRGSPKPSFKKTLVAPFFNVAQIWLHQRNQHQTQYINPGFYENLRGSPYPKKTLEASGRQSFECGETKIAPL